MRSSRARDSRRSCGPDRSRGVLSERARRKRPGGRRGLPPRRLGGEPLLAPERLLTALRRAESIFTGPALVSTNGTLLREPVLEQLAERRVELQVSIDSPDPARHDAGRGPGVHAQALAAVERVAQSGLRTIVSMVYTRDSLDEIEPFLEMAANAGAHEARLIPLRSVGGGREHAARRPDQIEVLERLLEILERRPELRGLLGRDYFSILMAICRASGRRTGCGIARRVVMLDADGEVYPCPNHARPEHRCGSVLSRPLERIFLDLPVLADMRETYRVEMIQTCRDCAFRHWCAGDCRGEALAVSGIPTSASPHCDGSSPSCSGFWPREMRACRSRPALLAPSCERGRSARALPLVFTSKGLSPPLGRLPACASGLRCRGSTQEEEPWRRRRRSSVSG